jgi:hypothetical protein
VSEPSTPSDPVQIRFCVFGEIKVDDDIDGLDVDASSEEVCADEVAADPLAKVVEDAVSVGLEHFCVRVETGVAAFGDAFCEEFDSVCRIAEYDGLVDLKLKSEKYKRRETLEKREFRQGNLSFSSTKA